MTEDDSSDVEWQPPYMKHNQINTIVQKRRAEGRGYKPERNILEYWQVLYWCTHHRFEKLFLITEANNFEQFVF